MSSYEGDERQVRDSTQTRERECKKMGECTIQES